MAALNYTDWMNNLNIPWLTSNTVGQAYNIVYGTLMDEQVDLFKQGIQARMPGIAPSDALPYLGQERSLLQAPDETDEHFAYRLRTIWQVGPYFGTTCGVLLQLYYQGFDGYHIQSNGLWAKMVDIVDENDPDFPASQIIFGYVESNGCIPGDPPYFSIPIRRLPTDQDFIYTLPNSFGVCQANRFILYCDSYPDAWPGGVPSESQLNVIEAILGQWKASSAIFEGLIVRNSGDVCNVPGHGAICGTTICGDGDIDIYLSEVYFPLT